MSTTVALGSSSLVTQDGTHSGYLVPPKRPPRGGVQLRPWGSRKHIGYCAKLFELCPFQTEKGSKNYRRILWLCTFAYISFPSHLTSNQEDTKIYRLDEDIDLSLYHKLMEEQLRTHEIFFRKHFLQVVWRYPESHDACLRIVVGIKCDEVNVKSVQIGRFDLKLREGAMWREPIETRDKVVDWTKEIVDWNREADKRDNWPKYARIGFIVIEFEVIFPRWNLQFDLVMEVPLKESEVGEGGKDLDPLGWDWAYELADVLSDNQPTWESLTFINYLGSLPHPL